MTKRDYYEVLELSRSASQEEIKKSYRKAALQFHPDRNPGDKASEESFKEATEAYQVLSNPESRSKYDTYGHAAFEGGAGMGGFSDFGGFEDLFGDIFSTFFGGTAGGSGQGRGKAGRDLQYDLRIDFEEAIFGTKKSITITREAKCSTCAGTGAAEGTSPETCQQCAGRGQVAMQQGFFTISRACPVCRGTGQIVRNPCATCAGRGVESVNSELEVSIPAGIDHGQRLKLRGEGESGSQGGPDGDLYVQVFVKDHPIFERDGHNLHCDIPINFAAAALGAEIEVPTLEGKATVKVPAGTPSGKVFRLRQKGVPVLGTSKRGDLHITVYVHVPKKMNEEQRQLLERLRDLQGNVPVDEGSGFFDKMKQMFSSAG